MESKITGKYYMILPDGERTPIRVNKAKMDRYLKKIANALTMLTDTIHDLYEDSSYDLYYFIEKEIFDSACMDVQEGKSWRLNYALSSIQELQNQLATQDDDIGSVDSYMTLEDYGYRYDIWFHKGWYEKILEDSDEQEVAEEIQFGGDKPPSRRIRTTVWEKTDYGKSSKEIRYKKLPIGKKLMNAILLTQKLDEKKE